MSLKHLLKYLLNHQRKVQFLLSIISEAHSWEIGQCMPNSTLHWQINFWFIYYFKEHFIIYI